MEYKYQLNKIKELNIASGQHYRGDCLFCLNRNTLSVRSENGRLSWNCFHANCDAKGSLSVSTTVDDLQNFLNCFEEHISLIYNISWHYIFEQSY